MSKKRIVLMVLAALLCVVIGVLLVMNSRYKVLFRSPRVSHETLVNPEKTRAVVMANVPLAKSLIERKLRTPGWSLPMALPYEAAFVIDVDRGLGDVAMKLFINEKRLAPMILQFANQITLPAPYDSWFDKPLRQERPGVLLREGLTFCSREIRDTVSSQWRDAAPPDALRVEGGHLLEAVVDNRDGSALAIASVFCDSRGVNLNQAIDEMVLSYLRAISAYRLQADLVSENELAVRVVVECDPAGDPSIPPMLQMLIEVGMSNPRMLEGAQQAGCSYSGSASVAGSNVIADYTFNIQDLLARF